MGKVYMEIDSNIEFINVCKEFVIKNIPNSHEENGDLTINIHGPFIFNYVSNDINVTFIKKCNTIYEKQYITNELDIFLDSFGIDYHN
jgi:hypothetical protein